MKSTYYILISTTLLLLFGCANNNDDDPIALSTDLPKIKKIEHLIPQEMVVEEFLYGEDGLLQVIKNFNGLMNKNVVLKYNTNGNIIKFEINTVQYNQAEQIETIKYYAYGSDTPILIKTREFNYNSDGKISIIKENHDKDFLDLLTEEQLLYFVDNEVFYEWKNNNVHKTRTYVNGIFNAEYKYTYDDKINFKKDIPLALKEQFELSENNMIVSEMTDYGGLVPFEGPTLIYNIIEYTSEGFVSRIHGEFGPDYTKPERKITYAN